MKPFKRTAMVAAVSSLFAPTSWGLGLGEITMQSYLNEPLKAEVRLLDVQGLDAEDIRIRLATQDDFDRLGVDRAYLLTSIRFHVEVEDGVGKVILTTEKPLLEPYLDFLVETRWPSGRLLREYTVLVDLPPAGTSARVAAKASEQRETSAPATVPPTDPEPQPVAAPAPAPERPDGFPDRPYDRDAEDEPRAGGQYLVPVDATLWAIAAKARPEGATVEQTMIATVEMNSDAFTGQNINGLKAGYMLQLPDEENILATTAQASEQVARHNSDWAKGIRRAPAMRVVADNDLEDATTDIDEDYATDAPMVATGDEASMASTDVLDDVDLIEDEASVLAGDAITPVAEQGATVPSPELQAIENRLQALSSQLVDLQQTVTLKDQQIAALQARLAAQEQARKMAAQEQKPETPFGMPWWLYALAGAVVAALGGWVYGRIANRPGSETQPEAPLAANVISMPEAAAPAAADSVAAPAPTDAPAAPEASVESKPKPQAGRDNRGYGGDLYNDYVEESAVSDAIAEADIYVAYGRYQQALDLLKTASTASPDSAAPLLKMLDIYLKTDRLEEAQELLVQIEQTHDMDAVNVALEKLKAPVHHGDEVELGELGDGPTAVAPAVDDVQLAPMDFDMVQPEAAPEPATSDAEEPLALDLDLNLSDDSASADLAASEPAEAQPVPEDTAIDDAAQELEWESTPVAPALDEDAFLSSADFGAEPALDSIDSPVEEGTDGAGGKEGEELVFASDGDPMDTKLDLARAYIDMGDEDGARPVLEEVIAQGDLQQQAEARELLIRIG